MADSSYHGDSKYRYINKKERDVEIEIERLEEILEPTLFEELPESINKPTNNNNDEENLPFCKEIKSNERRLLYYSYNISALTNPKATLKNIPIIKRHKKPKTTDSKNLALAIAKYRRNVFLED